MRTTNKPIHNRVTNRQTNNFKSFLNRLDKFMKLWGKAASNVKR